MADPENLVVRVGTELCSRCNCLYDKVFLFVEPVFTEPGGDGSALRLLGLATMKITPCCGYVEPTPINPQRVVATLELMNRQPPEDS